MSHTNVRSYFNAGNMEGIRRTELCVCKNAITVIVRAVKGAMQKLQLQK